MSIAVAESASASAPPAASAAASAPAKPAPTAGAGARFFRTCFIHVQRARTKLRSVHAVDCFLCFLVIGHLHKPESSRLAGITVFQNGNVVYLAISGKCLAQFVFSDFEIEISYVDIHLTSFFGESTGRADSGVTWGWWKTT